MSYYNKSRNSGNRSPRYQQETKYNRNYQQTRPYGLQRQDEQKYYKNDYREQRRNEMAEQEDNHRLRHHNNYDRPLKQQSDYIQKDELLPQRYEQYSPREDNVQRKRPKYVLRKKKQQQEEVRLQQKKDIRPVAQISKAVQVKQVREVTPINEINKQGITSQQRTEIIEEKQAKEIKSDLLDQKSKGQSKAQSKGETPNQIEKIIMPFEHPQHSHNNNFKLTYLQNQVSIVYKFNKGKKAFIKNGEITRNASSSFKIRQTQTEDQCIFIGIVTDAIFSDPKAIKSKFTATFYSRNGNVCLDGAQKPGGRSVKDGQIINFCVNTKSWELRWSIGDQLQVNLPFPELMRNKTIYLMIVMGHKDDNVHIMYN